MPGEPSTSTDGSSTDRTTGTETVPTLDVRFLGVGGFTFRVGEALVLTAPMYTNPDLLTVQFGDIASDPEKVDAFLEDSFVEGATGILVGHAHYDHLLDVPHIWEKTGGATVVGNTSARNLLAATGLPDAALLAVDDPLDPRVDTRGCSAAHACNGIPAGQSGEWIPLEGGVRVRALCSAHPDQIAGIHFGEGCVDDVPASVPTSADEWREGATVAYLIDFMDDDEEVPLFRVYYQDAPTSVPVGLPVPELLADKAVDLAVLNLGSYAQVTDHPAATIDLLQPRYVIAGHWEDFFRTQDAEIQPIPFHPPPEGFDIAATDALGPATEAPVLLDGNPTQARYFRVPPGTDLSMSG